MKDQKGRKGPKMGLEKMKELKKMRNLIIPLEETLKKNLKKLKFLLKTQTKTKASILSQTNPIKLPIKVP